jgi:hypothetical protein
MTSVRMTPELTRTLQRYTRRNAISVSEGLRRAVRALAAGERTSA